MPQRYSVRQPAAARANGDDDDDDDDDDVETEEGKAALRRSCWQVGCSSSGIISGVKAGALRKSSDSSSSSCSRSPPIFLPSTAAWDRAIYLRELEEFFLFLLRIAKQLKLEGFRRISKDLRGFYSISTASFVV